MHSKFFYFMYDVFMSESILVFTHRSVEFLTKLNASTSWQLNQNRAMLCDYVICVRNANSALAEKDCPHGSAFLVGKISNVVQSLNLPRDEHRYMIEFKEYSEISIPNVWQGWRSPVIYKNNNDIESLYDIDFETLTWKQVPKRDIEYVAEYFEKENKFYLSRDEVSTKFRQKKEIRQQEVFKPQEGLSIADAKKQISKYYEIPEEAIEIILRG